LLEPTQELDYGINLLLNSNTKSKLWKSLLKKMVRFLNIRNLILKKSKQVHQHTLIKTKKCVKSPWRSQIIIDMFLFWHLKIMSTIPNHVK
jgi:hypothetical protein